MKEILLLFSVLLIGSCGSSHKSSHSQSTANKADKFMDRATFYAESITSAELKTYLYTYASDEFEGRNTGEPGQKKAVAYLQKQYEKMGIPSPIAKGDYFQEIPASYFRGGIKASENVLAYIEGSEKPEEVIVISSHLDHIGVDGEGNVFNGADDDGSGTVSMLEMAQAFAMAKKKGEGPKRTILFLHVTGEEKGLYGSRYYTEHPVFPLENTIANLNIDMIGRVDEAHEATGNPNYIYLIGSDRLSTELHAISEQVNATYTNLELDYKYNDEGDLNRFYYRSDHYNFAKNNIPIIFYFNGTHEDYHRITDTPDKIAYELMTTRAKLVFYTAWELANRQERIQVDGIGE